MQQNTTEWLEFRSTKIGASDCPIIMQTAPKAWGTPLDLWNIKMGLSPSKECNVAMQYGKDMEFVALELFNEALESDFTPCVVTNPAYPWQIASLDGYNSSGSIAEIKCLGKKGWEDVCNKIIPEYYQWQMQHQMCVTDANYVFYVVYHEEQIKWIRYERDDDMIKILLDREAEFYECMRTGESPSPTFYDYKNYRNDPHFFYLEDQLCKVMAQMEKLQEQEDDLRLQLSEYTHGENAKGCYLSITRRKVKGSVEYNKIPELKDVDLNEYRKESYFKTTIKRIR